LVTNYHVIEGGVKAEVKLSNGEVSLVEGILSEDNEGDLVLLTLGKVGRTFNPLKLAHKNIEIGKPVVVIGSPFGLAGTVADGIVSSVREMSELGKILQITAPISKGSSGSPVLNMEGEVVGVATSHIREGQNLNFAISFERIRSLLSHKHTRILKLFESEKWSESAEGLFLFAIFFYNQDKEKAISYFKKSIQKKPNQHRAYVFMGWAYSELDRDIEAIEAFKQAIEIKPDDIKTICALGSFYHKLRRYPEAIEVFKHACLIKPGDEKIISSLKNSYIALALSYLKSDQYYDAVDVLKRAINIVPDDKELPSILRNVYMKKGLSQMESKRFYDAIDVFKQIIQIEPADAEAHYALGLAYILAGNKRMALEQYRILKELDAEKANELFKFVYE